MTFVELKWSTRFDSPSCLDTFNTRVELEGTHLLITTMCRNDKKLLKYYLETELFDEVESFELPEEVEKENKKLKENYDNNMILY